MADRFLSQAIILQVSLEIASLLVVYIQDLLHYSILYPDQVVALLNTLNKG